MKFSGVCLFIAGFFPIPFAMAQPPDSHLPLGRAISHPEVARPRVESGSNVEITQFELLRQGLVTAEERDKVIERVGDLKPKAIGIRRIDKTEGVTGGEYKVFDDIPENFHVGSTGAGPCIGLILTTPPAEGKRRVFVFHFNAGQKPLATIEKLGPYPEGTHAAIFGGDASEGSDRTLKGVTAFLDRESKTKKVVVDGYAKSAGLWVDRDGKYGTFGIEPWGTKPK